MATRFIYLFLLVFIVILHSDHHLIAQGFIVYQDKTFGTPENPGYISGQIAYYHNHLYFVGSPDQNPGGDQTDSVCGGVSVINLDLWLVKTDLQLNKIWDRCIGGNRFDGNPQFFINSHGQIVMSCRSQSDSSCEKSENARDSNIYQDYWVVAYDTNGNKLWDKTWGGALIDEYPVTVQLSGGNYITCGGSNSPIGYDKSVVNLGGGDYWCIKYDSAGNKIWDQVYGGTGGEYSTNNGGSRKTFYVIADEDDSFIIAGSISGPVSGHVSQPSFNPAYTMPQVTDIWLIKIDSLGNKLWDRRYGGDFTDILSGGIKKVDDGYIVVGRTSSLQGGSVSQPPIGIGYNQDVWVLKLDTAGNKIWDRRYGGTSRDDGAWIEPAIDGGYIICAQTNSQAGFDITEPPFSNQNEDYWIFKIDTAGNKLWDKRFGGPGTNGVANFVQMQDSSIYLFGYADSGTTAVKTDPGKGGSDYWVIHFKYTNGPTGITETVYGNGQFELLPNPVTDHLTVQYSPVTKPGKAILFNSLGEAVTEIILPPNTSSQKINISQFPPGIYLLRMETEKYSGARKFVKF